MFKHSPNGKVMVYGPNEIKRQWKRNYCSNGIYPQNLWSQWKSHGFINDCFSNN